MAPPSGSEIQADTARRFAGALRAAVRDKELEKDHVIRFYYDADVILRMVNGFQQFKYDGNPNVNPRNLMVRSLLSLGYAGPLYVLRPHVLEVHDALHLRPIGTDFKDQLLQFLEDAGIASLFMSLRQTILSTRPENDRLKRFLRDLTDAGPASFAQIELADGSWQQRLSRLTRHDLVHFDDGTRVMRDVLRDPVVWEIRDLIGNERKRRGQEEASFALSVLRDATALALLHREILRGEAGEKVPVVRFYSETAVLHETWRESGSRLRSLLTYQHGERGTDFIGRDADYFIVRMLLNGVRFQSKRKNGDDPSFATLKGLSEELCELTLEDENGLENFLENQVNEVPLKAYIDEFESLSFIQRFLRTYDPPDILKEAIKGFPEVWDFALKPETRTRFALDAHKILEQLAGTVRGLREAFSDVRKILAASSVLRQTKRPHHRPDPIKDLGLVRWGIALGGDDLERFNSLYDALVSDDQEEWWRGCADLADMIGGEEADAERMGIGCCVLWAINMFDLIVESLERSRLTEVGLKLLCLAAKVRGSRTMNRTEKKRLLEAAEEIVAEQPAGVQARYLIGLGYLYFHVWFSETHGDPAFLPDQTLRDWSRRAFDLGAEAVASLPIESLPWAFAVNHCVYIADVTHLQASEAATFRDLLARLEMKQDLWNYRFADTMGFHHLQVAKEVLAELERQPSAGSPAQVELVRTNVERAEQYYAAITAEYGDYEINTHRSWLMNLKERFHRFQVRSAAANSPRLYPLSDLQ